MSRRPARALILSILSVAVVAATAPTASALPAPSSSGTAVAAVTAADIGVPAGGWAIGPTESFTVTEPAEPSTRRPTTDCPPVGSTYQVSATPWFLPSTDEPHAVNLAPGQSVSWTTTRPLTFTAHAAVGPGGEVGPVVGHARSHLGTAAQQSRTFPKGTRVSTRNTGNRAYRAVVGTTGYSLIYTKTWQTAACTTKASSGMIVAPGSGGLTFGRANG